MRLFNDSGWLEWELEGREGLGDFGDLEGRDVSGNIDSLSLPRPTARVQRRRGAKRAHGLGSARPKRSSKARRRRRAGPELPRQSGNYRTRPRRKKLPRLCIDNSGKHRTPADKTGIVETVSKFTACQDARPRRAAVTRPKKIREKARQGGRFLVRSFSRKGFNGNPKVKVSLQVQESIQCHPILPKDLL